MEKVARGERKCAVKCIHVPAEQEAAGHGDAEHVVWVNGYAVCELGASKTRGGVRRAEDDAAAPGAVDVEPEVVRFAD